MQRDTTIQMMWAPQPGGRKNRYALYTLGGILGVACLAMLLAVGGTILTLVCGWPVLPVLSVLCLGVAALAVYLAVRTGRRSASEATLFLLTKGDALYVLDARRVLGAGHSALGMAADAVQVQKFLQQVTERAVLPYAAREICRVDSIKESATRYAVRCRLRHPSGRIDRQTILWQKGLPDEDLLLRQLERRESWENALEPAVNHNPFYILLSALACGGFVAVCVLSHPAVGRLPAGIYFPSLGAAFAALCLVVWFAVRQSRGE